MMADVMHEFQQVAGSWIFILDAAKNHKAAGLLQNPLRFANPIRRPLHIILIGIPFGHVDIIGRIDQDELHALVRKALQKFQTVRCRNEMPGLIGNLEIPMRLVLLV